MAKKKVGIITSGGDSSGMNQFIFSLKSMLDKKGIENILFQGGFKGIYEWDVANIENSIWGVNLNTLGGTIIGTSRFLKMKDEAIQDEMVERLKNNDITDLVILGGNGSYIGGYKLGKKGINVFLVPGTVDNDIFSSDYSIGYDSALNSMIEIIEQAIRSGISHKRFYIFELMSGSSSVLSNQVANSVSADLVQTLDGNADPNVVGLKIKNIMEKQNFGMMVVPDKFLISTDEKIKWIKALEKISGYEIRYEIPGRVQRGAKPSALDRLNAIKFANKVFEEILISSDSKVIALRAGEVKSLPIETALKKEDDRYMFKKDLKIFERINKW